MQGNAGAGKLPPKLQSYRVRLRGLAPAMDSSFIFEKIISCFSRHQRNLYEAPDLVLVDVVRFAPDKLDLLVKTGSKELLLKRLARLKLSRRSLRCRPFDPTQWKSRHGFAAWLVTQYGLDSSDRGRRKVRLQQRRPVGNNYLYHVWNRTAQQRLLFDEAEKDRILQVLTEICSGLPVQLHAFAILGNHFHLVVTSVDDVTISDLMQKVDQEISKRYNRRHKTRGALWQGPFCHTLWEPTAANLIRLIGYVHANPLRANLASSPEQYAWSSYSHYVGDKRRKMLVVPLPIRRLWPRRKDREAWYRRHFAEQYASGKLNFDPEIEKQGVIVGSKSFIDQMQKGLGGPYRLPAFLKDVIKLQKQGVVWGLKTLLHLLCQPMVDGWMKQQQAWKDLADRIGPLVPVREAPD